VKLFVDLSTMSLIEGPGLRSSVSAVRFKRGDSPTMMVVFLENGVTPVSIGDPQTLALEFGAKVTGDYGSDHVVHLDEWTMPQDEAASPSYIGQPNFNTLQLNTALKLGQSEELSSITLMGELAWRQGTGPQTSTRTFQVVVDNDVNRGGEQTPITPETPITNETFAVPEAVAISGDEPFVLFAYFLAEQPALHRLHQTEAIQGDRPVWSTNPDDPEPQGGLRVAFNEATSRWEVVFWENGPAEILDYTVPTESITPHGPAWSLTEFGVFDAGYSLHRILTKSLPGAVIPAQTLRADGIPDSIIPRDNSLPLTTDTLIPAANRNAVPGQAVQWTLGGVMAEALAAFVRSGFQAHASSIRQDLGLGSNQTAQFAGVQFPSVWVPSANANTIDDYRRGAFNPWLYGSTTQGAYMYSVLVGDYTKIGNMVHILCDIQIQSTITAPEGQLYIQLPFVPTRNNQLAATRWGNLKATDAINIWGNLQQGSDRLRLHVQSVAGINSNGAQMAHSSIQPSTRLMFNGSYRA
jgi:hypothetical protein